MQLPMTTKEVLQLERHEKQLKIVAEELKLIMSSHE